MSCYKYRSAAYLSKPALPLHHVVNHGALHHEGVLTVLLQHPVHPLLVGVGEHLLPLRHELPHLFVGVDCGILQLKDQIILVVQIFILR